MGVPGFGPVTSRTVIGALVLVVILLVFPVLVAMSGTIAAAILGWSLQHDVEQTHAGSDLLELNR